MLERFGDRRRPHTEGGDAARVDDERLLELVRHLDEFAHMGLKIPTVLTAIFGRLPMRGCVPASREYSSTMARLVHGSGSFGRCHAEPTTPERVPSTARPSPMSGRYV